MGNLDDILRDNDGTQVLPSVEQETKELAEEVRNTFRKFSDATETAAQANDVELLTQIKDRLNGGSSKKKARTTAARDLNNRAYVTMLVLGGIFGFGGGMIVAGLLKTTMVGTRFDSVSGWVSFLIVLVVTGLGVFLGSAVYDWWRKRH